MKNKFFRFTSVVLSCLLLISQNVTLAEGIFGSQKEDISQATSNLKVLGEVESRRSEYTKHFRMSDGTMQAMIYSDQVHYKDGDSFKEIDNSLVPDGVDKYKNTDSPLGVSVSRNFRNKNLITLSSDNHDLSWSYMKKKYKKFNTEEIVREIPEEPKAQPEQPPAPTVAESDPAEVEGDLYEGESSAEAAQEERSDSEPTSETTPSVRTEIITKKTTIKPTQADVDAIPETEQGSGAATIENLKDKPIDDENMRKMSVNKLCSKVKFASSDQDIDLDYTISGLSLNENIILNKKLDDNDRFDFICTTDLALTKDDNGNLVFANESGKMVFTMPKGAMWDSNNAISTDVEYEFTPISNGYIISVLPNRDWLESGDRLYPVTLNPPITTTLSSGIETTSASNGTQNTNWSHSNVIGVGAYAVGSNVYKGYVKCNVLPTFGRGEIITNARLELNLPNNASDAYMNNLRNVISVKSIEKPWDCSTMTYLNAPSTDNTIHDYVITDTINKWYEWDITRMAKSWYSTSNPNSNNGIELSSQHEDSLSYIKFVSAQSSIYPNDKPRISISYKMFLGEEDYWSYTTTKAGYKGVSNVNNYAGTLSVSEDVLSYSGSRNPLSIVNTYNNCSYNDQANGYVHDHVFANGYPHSSYTGPGFRLSFNQLIYPIPDTDPLYNDDWRYVYVDGDGTQHYFKSANNVFVDVDGLNLTATVNVDNTIELKDLKDNTLIFGKPYASDEAYVLLSSSDNEGNTITYNYGVDPSTPSSKINTITDSAGRVTTISYNNNAVVSAITAADGKQISFSYYDDGKLKEIAYPGDTEGSTISTGYSYDEQGRLSKVWTNAGVGGCVKYDYASNDYESTYFFKIRDITEYAGTDIDPRKAGRNEHFVYEMNQTNITHGINNKDVPYSNKTDIWQFDNEGLCTSVFGSDGNAVCTDYYSHEESGGKKNKVKHTNDASKYVNNLLKNTSAHDDLANWTVDNWIQSEADPSSLVSIDTTAASLGEKSFKIARDNASDAPWPILRQRVKIQKKSYDRKFTFSGDIKLPSSLSGGEGASLHLASFGSNGQQMSGDGYSKWLTSETDWVRESATINVPAGATEIECAFGLKESIGTALFDCLQLEESGNANEYNMVENSSFDNKLEKWDTTQAEGAIVEDGKLRIIGEAETDQKVSQIIPVNKSDRTFAVRATSHGMAVPNGGANGSRYCVECVLNFTEGAPYVANVWFNPNISDIQNVYRSIAPSEYGENRTVTSIEVSPCFTNNSNTVYFDNIEVYIDDGGWTYYRDSFGMPIKITNSSGGERNYDWDHGDVTQVTDSLQNQTDFNYGNLDRIHRLTDYTVHGQSINVKTALSHDVFGNVISSSIQKSDATGDRIETSTQYTQNGNYVSAQIDERGKTTEFTVNENNGNITKTKNPNNVETNFAYTNADRVVSETCGDAQTSYSYLNGVISSVSHKVSEGVNTVYNYVRDMFGNIVETKVGDRLLAKNTYDAGNGLIRQVKYGNEQTLNYDYDDQGRVIKKSFGYGKGNKFGEITYSYDDTGRISEVYDSLNDLTTKCEYDQSGRLVRTTRSDGTSSEIKYNNLNDLIDKVSASIFGAQTILNNTFGKLNKLLSSEINIGNVMVLSGYDYSEDTLERLSGIESLNYDSTSGLRHEFAYLNAEGNLGKTTNMINSVEIKKKVEGNWVSLGEKFNYAYDNVGNITDVTDLNNSLIAHYEYDSLNQLIRENNVQTGKTVTYQYNVGGNLTEKKTYSYTTDSDLTNATLESTVTYTYGDSNWPDKLTSITCGENEQAMIYDAIGNPLEYRDGWKCEWSRGHRLDKIENLGRNVNAEFKYDESVIRTQKIVNGVQTDFITSGIQLLAQKTGENTLIWQVDGNGNTVGFNYNNIPYFYMKNLQGDIIGITDASGNIVAKYTYDSWGKLISIKDASDVDKTTDTTFIGYINPLRYKGYYYDSETGLYYLNARYYDPEVCRFISADETLDGGYNLFEYCHNNPVVLYDPNGCAPKGPGTHHGGFATMDEAAIDWAYYYHPKAKEAGREFASSIYQFTSGKYAGRYYYRRAHKGNEKSVDVPAKPKGYVGWIHSHFNSSEPKAPIFAIAGDVDVSERRHVPGYVVTPAGDIQKYVPSGRKDDLGTLSWIYYDGRGLGDPVAFKDFKWGYIPVTDRDIRFHRLRLFHGSVTGAKAFSELWGLCQ